MPCKRNKIGTKRSKKSEKTKCNTLKHSEERSAKTGGVITGSSPVRPTSIDFHEVTLIVPDSYSGLFLYLDGVYSLLDDRLRGKNGQNKAAIFRFNPGKAQKVFPPKHPYLPKGCGDCEFNLGFKPGSETCKVCLLIRECWGDNTKSKMAVLKKHWLHEMESLYPKKVVVNGNGHPMSVGFRKYGNAHLYSDTFGRSSVLQKEDLPNIDVILGNATFVKKAGLSKTRKDNIKRFYYYRTTLRDKTIYLNVAEEVIIRSNGKVTRKRYLYSVTDSIK